jgi:DNA-binding Xre family transcriptional regulator
VSQLRRMAKKHNIHNAYQLQKITGFPVGMSYRLWRDDWKQVNVKTLNTLCNLFHCSPNDLLAFKPDPAP